MNPLEFTRRGQAGCSGCRSRSSRHGRARLAGPPTLLFAFVGALAMTAQAVEPEEPAVDFAREIRPLLARNCFACHGNDDLTREADLRLDRAEDAVADRGGYQVIVPGNREQSAVFRRIRTDDENLVMPPPDAGPGLTAAEIEQIGRWIDAGAEYSRHWAFEPPRRSPLPAVAHAEWPRNPLDHFVLAQLERRGMSPSPAADRYTLIRRLSLDLLGLPPSPADVEAFVNDTRPDAYERLVDRLLASPRFGERWAQVWLDLVRYADSMGYEKDLPRTIWRYRDWVIDAYNADRPFDQFTRDQLAGDLLADATPDQILATAMHRNTLTNQEGGTDDEEFRVAAVKDRVDTTMQVWMGLTMGCAKCHSHKYDPLTMDDYYSFFAIFNQTADADRGDDQPTVETPTRLQRERIETLDRRIAMLEKQIAEGGTESTDAAAELAALREQRSAIQPPRTPVMRELPAGKRRTTHLHVRGNFLDPGPEVQARLPAALSGEGDQRDGNELDGDQLESAVDRLEAARWLTADDNPLTARVQVNRVWARMFGRGLVETEEDFGTQGEPPSHPALLDWLAVDFQEHGGSLKHLCRRIVTSETYRQAAIVRDADRAADPDNRWLSHGPRVRLEAETVRDQALAVAGLLDHRLGGPSVMPPQPPGIWRVTYSTLKWEPADGADRYRRGLYTYWRRTSPYPSMLTFDAGSRETCVIRRVRTNTPLQALVTLNDPAFIEAAGALAARVLSAADDDTAQRIRRAFQLVLTRPPTNDERTRLVQLIDQAQQHFANDPTAAQALLEAARVNMPEAPEAQQELATWTTAANVLLNLDETLTKP